MSGGLPASMAATNFCSRSPKVAQSVSTWTFRSFAQSSTWLARMSLLVGHEALEEPHPELGAALGVGHLFEHAEPGRGAAGDDGGLAEEFPAGDDVGVELLGE